MEQHEDKTFTELLLELAKFGPRPCYSFVPADQLRPTETLSYAEVLDRALCMATSLRARGVEPGDRVALFAQPTCDYLVTAFGTVLAGGIAAPVNHNFKAAELGAYLTFIEPKIVVCDDISAEIVVQAAGQQHACWQTLRLGGAAEGSVGSRIEPMPWWENWEPATAHPAMPDDAAVILHTSGTTALPKAVLRTQRQIGFFMTRWAQLAWLERDVLLSYLPAYHQGGSLTATWSMMVIGGHSIQWQRFSASRFWDVVDANRVTVSTVIPPAPTYLLLQPPSSNDKKHTLEWVVIGGRTDHWSDFQERFGVIGHSAYGSTETTYVTCSGVRNTPPASRDELYGAIPHFYAGPVLKDLAELRIVGPDNGPVAPGEPGQIQVRGPAVFDTYFRAPQATADVFTDDGWFNTGDIGYLREDSYLFMIDRANNVIRRSSENISPQEIEIAVSEHPDVNECVVLGVPDDIRGQEILVSIVLEPGATPDPGSILAHCELRLSSFKVPRYFEFRTTLPRTPTGKVRKEQLTAESPGVFRFDRLNPTNAEEPARRITAVSPRVVP